ncbi:MAG: FixH family protein [Bacteroidetes bacterium]|nr:FixH family protein [Bacteroidota bacterium]
MKFSWGTGITLSYVIFITVVIGVVIYFHTLDVNLVSDNYYEQEIKHQGKIDKAERANNLSEKPDIKVDGRNIYIKFPTLFNADEIEGSIVLFRPSNKNKDLTIPLNLNNDLRQNISTNKLDGGVWRIQIDWIARDISYYIEKIIMVN